jgi:hypothetical protein
MSNLLQAVQINDITTTGVLQVQRHVCRWIAFLSAILYKDRQN